MRPEPLPSATAVADQYFTTASPRHAHMMKKSAARTPRANKGAARTLHTQARAPRAARGPTAHGGKRTQKGGPAGMAGEKRPDTKLQGENRNDTTRLGETAHDTSRLGENRARTSVVLAHSPLLSRPYPVYQGVCRSEKTTIPQVSCARPRMNALFAQRRRMNVFFAQKARMSEFFATRLRMGALFAQEARMDVLFAQEARVSETFGPGSSHT